MAENKDNPELRDLDYQQACCWYGGYRDLPQRLKSGVHSIRKTAETFAATVDRLDSLMILPGYLMTQAAISQRAKDVASMRVRNSITDGVGFGPVPDDLKAAYEEIVIGFQKSIAETDSIENLARGNRGLRELMLESTPRIRRGVESILFTQITMAWTAIESLATDLWIGALNARPMSLGDKAIAAQPERKDRPIKIVETTSDPLSRQSTNALHIDVLRRYGFNLSNKIGTMIWHSRKFNFNRLGGIQYAYAKVFADCARNVFKKYDKLRSLEAVRNLLLHRGGVIDSVFVSRTKNDPNFVGIREGETISLNGGLSSALTDSAVRCAIDLIEMVDEWLAKNVE